MKKILLFLLLFSATRSFSQNGNKDFVHYKYMDSLTASSPKDPNGRIFKEGELEFKVGGKLYVYLESELFDVYLLIKTPSGKWMTKQGIVKNEQFYTKSQFSFVSFDTTLTEVGKYLFYFSTVNPGSMGKFGVDIIYAPQESMQADPKEKDFCKQIEFLHKHAEAGFRFLRAGNTRYKDTTSATLYNIYYYSLVPQEWFNDFNQRIERSSMLSHYRYHAKIFLGSYDESKARYHTLCDQLKACLGSAYTFDEKITEKGNVIFSATVKDPDPLIIKTWAAWRKDVKFRYEISMYRYADAPNSARILLDITNYYEAMDD